MKTTKLIIATMAIATLTSCELKHAGTKATNQPETEIQNEEEEQEYPTLAVNSPAPDFSLPNPEGKMLSLSDFRGQVVVLDFWGSWCKWCIKGMPALMDYYSSHQGDFVIIGIDCRESMQAWSEALSELQLPWEQVYLGDDKDGLLSKYMIQGFPTKVIVDADGNIFHTTIGEDETFFQYLDEALE